MKKTIIAILIIFMSLGFVGCQDRELEKLGKSLSSYEICVDLVEGAEGTYSLKCKENLEYKNNTDSVLKNLNMHLYANAFRQGAKHTPVSLSDVTKAYPNGMSYGGIEINGVSVDGQNVEFDVCGADSNILAFDFLKALYPGDKASVEIEFDVTLPNVNHRFGYGNNTINLANFFPIACVWEKGEYKCDVYSSNGDPFYSECSNFDVKFSCDKKYVVASSGKQKSVKEIDGRKTLNIEATAIRDFAIVCSEKFNHISQRCGETEINYYYYSDQNPEKSLETSVKAVMMFNDKFGKYPYPQLSVVEANFVHGGMEYPNLIYISDACSTYEEYTNVIVHEIAHQWWYGMVGNNEYSSSWLDEGLTEYSTAMFYEEYPEYEIDYKDIVRGNWKNYALFVGVYQNVLGKVDTTMDRELNQYSTDMEYVYITYVKGMLLFDSLREIVGKEKFVESLRLYFDENKYKISNPEALISAFEKTTNTSLESFFSAWINGKIIIVDN